MRAKAISLLVNHLHIDFLCHHLLSQKIKIRVKNPQTQATGEEFFYKIGDWCVLPGYMPNSHLYTQMMAINLSGSDCSKGKTRL